MNDAVVEDVVETPKVEKSAAQKAFEDRQFQKELKRLYVPKEPKTQLDRDRMAKAITKRQRKAKALLGIRGGY